MKVQVNRYWAFGRNGVGTLDREASVPAHEVDDEQAVKMMGLLEEMGLKKCENSTQWFYSMVVNCHETTEYIFYK